MPLSQCFLYSLLFQAVYYFAIIEDFLIRFSWIAIVTLHQQEADAGTQILVGSILVVLEVFR